MAALGGVIKAQVQEKRGVIKTQVREKREVIKNTQGKQGKKE